MKNTATIYHASSVPDFDPIRNPPHLLYIVANRDETETLGRAELAGWMLGVHKPMATYRLMIGGNELPGLFTCTERRFERIDV